MLFDPDGSPSSHQANHTLNDALSAQLTLLDGFFPLQGWVVGRRRDDRFIILAAQGEWHDKQSLTAVGELMDGRWVPYTDHPGFHYRTLSADEQGKLSELLAVDVPFDCIVRRPLRNRDGDVQAWLIGAADQRTISTIMDPSFPVEYVKQTVAAMSLCMTLHADFEYVHRQLHELQKNAYTEPLTGVLNRAGWMNRVEHIEAIVDRSEEDVAILMLDLDLLKLVNDLQGHSAGDELLQLTAQTIQSVLRTSDVVGRLGGDEFGVAVRGVGPAFAASLISRLRDALNRVGVDVSIGLALKSEAASLQDTLILADKRMYEEKRSKPMPNRAMNWKRGVVEQRLDS